MSELLQVVLQILAVVYVFIGLAISTSYLTSRQSSGVDLMTKVMFILITTFGWLPIYLYGASLENNEQD